MIRLRVWELSLAIFLAFIVGVALGIGFMKWSYGA